MEFIWVACGTFANLPHEPGFQVPLRPACLPTLPMYNSSGRTTSQNRAQPLCLALLAIQAVRWFDQGEMQ